MEIILGGEKFSQQQNRVNSMMVLLELHLPGCGNVVLIVS